MTEHACRWIDSQHPRMLRTHQAGCDTPGCSGCQPCPERHCQVCGRAHVTVDGRGHDQTCAACLGQTRQDGAEIVRLAGRTLDEAVRRGVTSQAAMLAGPAADPETYGYRRMSALAGRIDAAWLDDCRDEQHPLWVLGTWDMLAREHLAQSTDRQLTVTRAWSYLDTHLTRLAHDPDFAFDELAADLRRCRGHLEDVLAEGERPERGAPCPACGRADLEKSWGASEGEDRWTCPRCGQWWSEGDYRLRVGSIYLGVADRLTASQIAETYRVPEATLRKWVQRDRIKPIGRDQSGRQLFSTEQVVTLRDGEALAS